MFCCDPEKVCWDQSLGKGAFGNVYPYRSKKGNDKWVVKVLQTKNLKETISCFQEIVLGFSCDHFAVLPIKGYFFEPRKPIGCSIYIKMPRMQGDLRKFIKNITEKHIVLREEEIVKYFYALTCGLDYLHNKRIAHRDIKPENILIDIDGHLKIADIGGGALIGEDESSFRVANEEYGTRLYLPQEVLFANGQLKLKDMYKVDAWSLGVVIAELCAVPRVYGNEDQSKVWAKLSKLEGKYSQDLRDILAGLLTVDRNQRASIPYVKKSLETKFSAILKDFEHSEFHLEIPKEVNIDFHTNSDTHHSTEKHDSSLQNSTTNKNNLHIIELNNQKYLPISEIEGISDEEEKEEEETIEEVKIENSRPRARTKTSGGTVANLISESFQIDNLADLIEYFEEKLFPGEKIATYINCTLIQMHNLLFHVEGVLFITNFKACFRPKDANFLRREPLREKYLQVPMAFVTKSEKHHDKASSCVYLDIQSKEGQLYRYRVNELFTEEVIALMNYIDIFAFPYQKQNFFAFEHGKNDMKLEEKYEGWKVYDIEKEFKRQGIIFKSLADSQHANSPTTPHKFKKSSPYKIVDNSQFNLCEDYPPKILVPSHITEKELQNVGKFRRKNRIPCITYHYNKAKTILARSSQPKPGIYHSRCQEDEKLLRLLGDPNDIDVKSSVFEISLHIYNARSYLNSVANMLKGKGFEDTKSYYKHCEMFFMEIESRQKVRESQKRLITLCASSGGANYKWLSQLETSNWLELVSYIINASSKVAASLRDGKSCLVHCAKGQNQSAQIVSLAQILLDPYFRTIEGFEVLVMKDWVYFGHPFEERMGHGQRNEKDERISPLFIQFLDCVIQLLHQFPSAFEFNEKFLLDLAYNSYTCQYGTFLFNSYKDIQTQKAEEKTVSIWSYLNSQKKEYENAFYVAPDEKNQLVLNPSCHMKHMRLWDEYFLFYSWLSRPRIACSPNIIFEKDFYANEMAKQKRRNARLQAKNLKLKYRLKDAQSIEKSGIQSPFHSQVLHNENGNFEIAPKEVQDEESQHIQENS